ncbi:hypothetical protein QZH41_001884 [Actinostola sp. cb2023]|nr:hypothetical protein QZH41_001884 [Actinostola sp. cb2023]
MVSNHIASEDVTLDNQLERFWRVESYGAERRQTKPTSVEDRRAMRIIEETICKEGLHYKMGLLWKGDQPNLPYNRPLAEARLQYLKRRLLRDPELLTKYRTVIQDYLTKGYARKLTTEEAGSVNNKTWYLPHHPVSNPNKPGKTRVVFDAAAKFGGTSLNDQLLQGPSLINDLSGVLIRFRQDPVAFTADIEAMFYQTRVTETDTDALRFLWWPNNLDESPEDYKMMVHIFGAKSSPCCANKALRTTAEENAKDHDPEVVRSVQRNFYVDDVLKSTSTVKEAISLATGLMKLLKQGGFRLTKFTSNHREVLATIPPTDRANPTLDLDLDKLPMERALGIYWDAESDTFSFKVLKTNKPSTKRGILSVTSSLFDPLGFLPPLTLTVKILLQELWRTGATRDEDITEPYLSQWRKWLEDMPRVVNVRIPRCYMSPYMEKPQAIQLHTFSDASRRGIAAVAYLRQTNELGKVQCAFVMGKARNTPLKDWTIPRLELQAAVLAIRLSNTVRRELDLDIDSPTFWTDSMTTLQYIRNTSRRFSVFVANRLTEIHENSSPVQWRHVPGRQNPADEGSRGTDIQYFQQGCRWWNGPDFLWLPEEQWHIEPDVTCSENVEEETINTGTTMFVTSGSQIELLLKHYSSWSHLLRVMSWILRFIKCLKKEQPRQQPRVLALAEIKNTSHEVVRLLQRQSFQEEYVALRAGQQVKRQSRLANLNPILSEDGIIRVGGRIHRDPIAFTTAHPIILPKDHPVSELMVRYYHKILGHAGREHVLSAIRQSFWILQARSLVRRILH